jgi:hypothetical protein
MLAEFSAKAERLEQEKLESSGKLQEALEAVKKKLVDVETKAKAKENMFLYNTLKSRVREHAKELGCINPDALLKLSKFDEIKVGEDYEIDSAQVKVALEKSVQEHPYLFKKEVPAVKDITPGNKIETGNSKELKDMPLEKLTQMLAEQLPR